jgi:hypothetical protein
MAGRQCVFCQFQSFSGVASAENDVAGAKKDVAEAKMGVARPKNGVAREMRLPRATS